MVAWMSVLALVPWGKVIEATPGIVQAAKKLLGSTRKGHAPDAATTAADPGALLPADEQLRQLRDRVTQLEREQRAGALLIESLAEQNAQMVQAIEVLRRRSQRSAWALLTLGAAGLLGWLLWWLRS